MTVPRRQRQRYQFPARIRLRSQLWAPGEYWFVSAGRKATDVEEAASDFVA
jgi:hypothetical protein